MKAFKRYSAARKAANGEPIIRIGSHSDGLYIVGADKITEICLLSKDGAITGNVTLNHLDRLGNANWAVEYTQPFHTTIWEHASRQTHKGGK